ncbi:MAG: cytochrome c-type biogenesis protein CcmH [Ilumatobacter sp.]|uniref:cytochrome c-type biogenesis protein n=1 Tax=Ilumatobacter sp. TaxID=1967498 RepID=UPI003919D7F7
MNAVTRFARSPLGWTFVIAMFVGLVVFGSAQSPGPQTQEDRVDAITSQVACPICDGESVFESRNSASRAIRNEVDALVRSNELSDEQILARIENAYGREVMLVPESSGLDAVAWIAPIVAFLAAAVGLVAAFARWRRLARQGGRPTEADRRLVEAARVDSSHAATIAEP